MHAPVRAHVLLGQAMREVREHLGVAQAALAGRMGNSQSYVARFENAHEFPRGGDGGAWQRWLTAVQDIARSKPRGPEWEAALKVKLREARRLHAEARAAYASRRQASAGAAGDTSPNWAADDADQDGVQHRDPEGRAGRLAASEATGEAARGGDSPVADAPELMLLWESLSDVQRRAFLTTIVGGFGGLGIAAPMEAVWLPLWDRLDVALRRTDDDLLGSLDQLQTAATQLWQRYSTTASTQLIRPVSWHLQVATQLLERPLAPEVRQRLRSVTGELARQAAWLSFDLHNHDDARRYYAAAIKAASMAGDAELHAHVLGCMSFLSLYDRPQEALAVLSSANQLAPRVSMPLQAWLAALEAEGHAVAGEPSDCGKALDRAQAALSEIPDGDSAPALVFDEARRKTYVGGCLLRFGASTKAEPVLQAALALSPTPSRQRANVLAHLAQLHIQRREIDHACGFLRQSLDIAIHTRQAVGLRHIRQARAQLEPYRATEAVKALDERLLAQ